MAFLENPFGLPKGVLKPDPTTEIASIVIVKDRCGFDQDSKILIVKRLDQGSKRNGKVSLIVIPVLAGMVMIKETQAQSNVGIGIAFLDKIVGSYELQTDFSAQSQTSVKEEFLVWISPYGDEIAGILKVDPHTDLSGGDVNESQEKEGREKQFFHGKQSWFELTYWQSPSQFDHQAPSSRWIFLPFKAEIKAASISFKTVIV